MDEIKINKKTLIIVSIALITVLLLGSLIFLIKNIPLVSAAGTCNSGDYYCEGFNEAECNACGCDWDFELEDCGPKGFPMPCDGLDEIDCDYCGCIWTPGLENFYINVGDSWLLAQDVFVNVGDVWQDAEAVYVNVGDVWRLIYST